MVIEFHHCHHTRHLGKEEKEVYGWDRGEKEWRMQHLRRMLWTTSVLFLVFCGCDPGAAVVTSPCALTDLLINKFGVKKGDAAHWACLAKYASGFNTQALGSTHKDGSDDFGIFQINDMHCRKGTKNSCGVSCTELVSNDLTPSATCALNIFKKEGFGHWPAWKNNCKDIDVSRFIEKCDVKPKG